MRVPVLSLLHLFRQPNLAVTRLWRDVYLWYICGVMPWNTQSETRSDFNMASGAGGGAGAGAGAGGGAGAGAGTISLASSNGGGGGGVADANNNLHMRSYEGELAEVKKLWAAAGKRCCAQRKRAAVLLSACTWDCSTRCWCRSQCGRL